MNTEQFPIQPEPMTYPLGESSEILDDALLPNDDMEANVEHDASGIFTIAKFAVLAVIVAFILYKVWNNAPLVAFGLYLVPMVAVTAYFFKQSKVYGTLTLLMGLSMFSFLWNHNGVSLALGFVFGALTFGVYGFRKWVEEKEVETIIRDTQSNL